MSKMIKLTPECLDEVRRDFEKSLATARASDGKITFTKILAYVKRNATLYFTEKAWSKMQGLIRKYDTEVGWHGVAKRGDDPEKDEYIITDILVPYPQTVTGATVNTDQKEYDMWLYSEDNDEVFNDIRFHGHSHVNMQTSPSGVDTTHWDGILAQLTDEMFYIFAIWNKKGDKTVKIYDFAKNVLFDTNDIDIKIIEEEDGIEAFLKKSEERVKTRPTVSYVSTTTNKYTNGFYGGNTYTPPTTTSTSSKKDDKKNNNKNKNERKGKRVDIQNTRQMTMFDDGIGGW